MTYLFVLDEDLKTSYLAEEDLNIVEFEYIKFNGGEPHLTIKNHIQYNNATEVVFTTKLKNGDDFLKLAAAVNAFTNLGTGSKFYLEIAYYPGSRQDRVCNPGEVFSAKMYANLLSSITQWESIQILDQHSDVSSAVLTNGFNNSNIRFVNLALNALDITDGVIVSPDAGANKKVYEVAKVLNQNTYGIFDVVRADKLRNLKTGEIIETTVYADDLKGKTCIIIDDICDGGRTFIELAKVLKAKGASHVILIVTHGIFSKGFAPLLDENLIDQIVTTNSFIGLDADDGDRVTVLGINQDYFKRS